MKIENINYFYLFISIGCVLANNKCFFNDRNVFYLIATDSTNFRGVWLNIANVYFEQKQYSSAIKMVCNGIFVVSV